MKRSRGALAVLAAAVLVSACSGGGGGAGGGSGEEPDARDSGAAELPQLEQAWVSDARLDVFSVDSHVVGDVLALAAEDTITGLDLTTGEQLWALPVGDVCEVSETQDAQGRFAVTFASAGPNGVCRQLGVVDPVRGAWVWRKRLPEPAEDPTYLDRTVAIGDSTVTVLTSCCYRKALRFDLATGRQLRTLDPDLTGWGADVVTDGQVIALASGLDRDSHVRLALYDADTGRRLWQRTVTELVEENVAASIISSDPLVIATSERGHRLIWRLDPRTGRRLQPIGPQGIDHAGFGVTPVGVRDGVVLVGLGQQSPLSGAVAGLAAFDLETGEEQWAGLPEGGALIDLEDSGDLIATYSGRSTSGTVVARHALADVDEVEVLGTFSAGPPRISLLAGELLVVIDDGRPTAYRLPAEGEAPDTELPELSYGEEWRQAQTVDADRWEEGDVRPGDIATCHPSTATLRALGFHRLGLPAQAGCRWYERQDPLGVTRDLEVNYQIGVPPKGKNITAVQHATRVIGRASREAPFDHGPVAPGAYVPVAGIGDEAYASVLTGPGPYGEVHLLVRVANVVVQVVARGEAETTDVAGATVPTYLLEEGALAAAEDVLAQAGLTLGDLPERSVGGRFARLAPACAPFDAAVRAYVASGRRLDQRASVDPERRTAGCYWGDGDGSYVVDDGERQYFEYAKVSLYAVPGTRLGRRTGVELARSGIEALRAGAGRFYYEKPRPVPGLGDQALLFPALGHTSEAKVVVRVDNLLIEVSINDQADPDLALRDARALEIARTVVARYA